MPAGGYSRPWTADEDAYVQANYSLMPCAEIGAHIGRSRTAVNLRGLRFGLVSYQRIGTASIRHDYFTEINTPEKAYVLGLIASDGCISRDAGQLKLDMSTKDIAAIEFARNQIAPAARLKDYQPKAGAPMTRFIIQSPQLAADLARYGVTPAKSHSLPWPSPMDDRYAGSFVGGLFDGDGSLSTAGYMRWALVSASGPLLEAIQQRAFSQTGVWIGGPYRDKRQAASSLVATGRGQVRDLCAWMSAEVPGLARKRL